MGGVFACTDVVDMICRALCCRAVVCGRSCHTADNVGHWFHHNLACHRWHSGVFGPCDLDCRRLFANNEDVLIEKRLDGDCAVYSLRLSSI
jgi:hypothetical protein